MNNSYITIIKEKRTVLSRKRVPLNQNECTADFRIGVPFEQNLHVIARGVAGYARSVFRKSLFCSWKAQGAQGDAGALEKISPIWNSHIQSVICNFGSIFLCQDLIRICKLGRTDPGSGLCNTDCARQNCRFCRKNGQYKDCYQRYQDFFSFFHSDPSFEKIWWFSLLIDYK